MPNWCYNTTFIYGDKKQLEEFWNVIEKEIIKGGKGLKTNSWDNLWLGNIFLHFYNEEEANKLGLVFRGAFLDLDDESLYYNREKGFIQMKYETAWSPNIESWEQLLYDFFPKLKHATEAEESGMGIYVIKDDEKLFFNDKYVLDALINDDFYTEYFSKDEDLINFVNNEFNKNYKSIKELLEDKNWVEEIENNNGYFLLNEFEDYYY